jgi:short-subunit dehydrogenase
MESNNQTVLITGATSGIGLELAKLFAKDHYNLVLVARNVHELNETAKQLKELGSVSVTVIPKDLSVPGSAESVHAETWSQGVVVDILVNDAGMGEHGLFVDSPLDRDMAIIQLNIASLVAMTKLYLRDMVQRNNGRILQLASIASYQPTPLLGVYAATKAFVLSFTDMLINELKDTKVTMTALIPGPTDTDFFSKAGAENVKATRDLEDPAVVAKIGYDALLKGEHHAVAPGMKKQILMSSMMPNETVAAMARKQMEPDTEKKESANK